MSKVKIFNCIKCPHYEVPDAATEFVPECFLNVFNQTGDCPCTNCEDIWDCSDWCSEYYKFEETILNLNGAKQNVKSDL